MHVCSDVFPSGMSNCPSSLDHFCPNYSPVHQPPANPLSAEARVDCNVFDVSKTIPVLTQDDLTGELFIDIGKEYRFFWVINVAGIIQLFRRVTFQKFAAGASV